MPKQRKLGRNQCPAGEIKFWGGYGGSNTGPMGQARTTGLRKLASLSDADDADGDYASSGEFVTSIALFVVVFRSNTFVTHAFSTYLILHSIDSLLINDICV